MMKQSRTEVEPVIQRMDLIGHGRMPWSEVRELAKSCWVAWADYEGFHVRKQLPEQCPPYSHIWAWPDDEEAAAEQPRWLRIRPAGDIEGQAIVGELRLPSNGGSPTSAKPRLSSSDTSADPSREAPSEPVNVQIIGNVRLWPLGDSRVSPKGDDLTRLAKSSRSDADPLDDNRPDGNPDNRKVYVLEVLGPAPVTFVHVGDLPPAAALQETIHA